MVGAKRESTCETSCLKIFFAQKGEAQAPRALLLDLGFSYNNIILYLIYKQSSVDKLNDKGYNIPSFIL